MKATPDGLPKFCTQPWAITQSGGFSWLSTFRYEAPAVRAVGKDIFGNDLPALRIENGCAIIPIKGVLIRGCNPIEEAFGAVSHYSIADWIDQAEANPKILSVLFDIDSPGGTCSGTSELAEKIADMKKPTAAFSDGLIGSAAYWLASQCDTICCTSGALVGAIGAIITLTSIADMLTAMGVSVDIFQSGSLKSAGSELKKMTDDEKTMFQNMVNQQGTLFRNTVRNKRPAIADADMQGQVHLTSDAVTKGLVDKAVTGMREGMATASAKAYAAIGASFIKQTAAELALKGPLSTARPVLEAPRVAKSYEEAFAADANLRREFGTVKCYEYYMRGTKQPPPVIASAPVADPLETEFENSPALRREFGSIAVFRAFKRAERHGSKGESPRREAIAAAVNLRRPSPTVQAKLEAEWASLPLETKKEWGNVKAFIASKRSHKVERYEPLPELEQ